MYGLIFCAGVTSLKGTVFQWKMAAKTKLKINYIKAKRNILEEFTYLCKILYKSLLKYCLILTLSSFRERLLVHTGNNTRRSVF